MFQSTISKAALLLLGTALFAGCATAQSRWPSVIYQNTRTGYEQFVRQYPGTAEANEAKRRFEDPDYAFLATCRIPGDRQRAFEGFLASHPSSDYAPVSRAYLEFLKETGNYDLDSYKRFAARHPAHPFAPLARVRLPVLWLKETGRKAGLAVKVSGLIHRGILRGGYGDAEKIRLKTTEALKKELESEGLKVVLLDDPESDRVSKEGIGAIILADYSESKPPPTSAPIAYRPTSSAIANALYWDSGQTLANLFSVTPVETLSISVKGVNDGVEYFSNFRTLSTPTGRVNQVAALQSIGSYSSPAGAMAALQQPDLIKPEERKTDEELLKQLKRTDGVSVARRPDDPMAADREKAIEEALEEVRGPAASTAADEQF